MQGNRFRKAYAYVVRRRRRRIWQRIVGALACALVLCTAYALTLPAVTLEKADVDLTQQGSGSAEAIPEAQQEPVYRREETQKTEPNPSQRTESDAAVQNPSRGGFLDIKLLYGDEKPQSEHPDGVFEYTHSSMSGYISVEPRSLTEDLTDVTLTLTVPKQYVERSTLTLPDFQTTSASVHQLMALKEEGDNYVIGVYFKLYDKTETLKLPFALSFLDDKTPENYRLPVTATVSYGNNTSTTEPNIYKPKYDDWEIVKFVNINNLWAFSKDYAEAVVTPQEPDGNPYLDDLTYVDFQFVVNGWDYYGQTYFRTENRRDVSSVTLTDTLPVYTDVNGTQRIAVFDAEKNPTWTLSADEKSVSKTYTGADSNDVLRQIKQDEPLHLRFPGVPFTRDSDGFLIADLTNSVRMTATPSNKVEGESEPEAEDSLIFRLTNKDEGEGSFTKQAAKGNIYDNDSYKTNGYPWLVRLSNQKPQPLKHIIIEDREIKTNDSNVVLEGLDKRLKFTRLEFLAGGGNSVLPAGKSFADIIQKVTAYYSDGSTQDYAVTEADGVFSVPFDENKSCEGYKIVFADDYQMRLNEAVALYAYTVYRDPQNTHADQNNSQNNIYRNTARAVNSWTRSDGQTVYKFLTARSEYKLLPFTENLWIGKSTYYNGPNQNNTVGSEFAYLLTLRGSLLEPEVKQYENLRVIDLLPPGLTYSRITNGKELFGDLNTYRPEIIENYHNSGRTAVIFRFTAEALRAYWKGNSLAPFTFFVRIDATARPGTVRNDIYVVGDNLEDYQNATGGAVDVYDLDDDGKTDDRIAYAHSDAVIITASSIYAEKFITAAGGDNWTKQGLNLKVGSDFDYLLKITNDTAAPHTGLVVYDVLPNVGDKSIFLADSRNSEFPVRLRAAIVPPEGYEVYYTTSADVFTKTMREMIAANVWTSSVADYSQVTAFKLVAKEGTKLEGKASFQVRVPVCVASELSEASMAFLNGKDASYLEAINAFGFTTNEAPAEKESNTVWARIPFAGFTVKKVDSRNGQGLSGAEFTLTDKQGTVVQTLTSDASGLLRFSALTAGTYTLTETKAPKGYVDAKLSLTVSIVQNPVTMEYSVTFDGAYAGSGTADDPLIIENESGYERPQTGGVGTEIFYAAGFVLLLAAALLCLAGRRRNAEM